MFFRTLLAFLALPGIVAFAVPAMLVWTSGPAPAPFPVEATPSRGACQTSQRLA